MKPQASTEKILSRLRDRIFPSQGPDQDPLSFWRERILSTMLLSGIILASFIIPIMGILAVQKGLWILFAIDTLIWFIAIFLLLSPAINFRIRAGLSMLMMYGLGLAIIFNVGFLSGGPIWLFGFAVLTGVLLGFRAALAAVAMNGLALAGTAGLFLMQELDPSFPFFVSHTAMVLAWVNFLFLNALVAISVSVLVRGLIRIHEQEMAVSASLQEKQALLEAEIRERREAESALRESEEKYREILENIEDGYFEADLDGAICFFNDAACRILGYSRTELMGMHHEHFVEPALVEKMVTAFNRVFHTGEPTRVLDWRLIRKNGEPRSVEMVVSLIRDRQGNGVGFRGIARDVTDRKRLENQLRQAHKMESVGRLAGGIAHDFNNVLYIIMGNAELAMEETPEGSGAREFIERINNASVRAAGVVRQLLNFSRDSGQALEAVDLAAVVAEEAGFLRSTLPALIEIRHDLPHQIVPVLADPVQIRQVLMNICTNASQAMEETGGLLKIGLTVVTVADAVLYPDLAPGEYARLTIRDTGPGIADQDLDRIFDPYFTTRDVGQGSGMGLAVAHGIVTHHNGAIAVESLPGQGAEFRILLPLTDTMPAKKTEVRLPETLPRGNETVLLVDDEDILLQTTQKVLETLGYTVDAVARPDEALDRFRSEPDRFDLLITDMTMPGMTGSRLAEKIMAARPDLPVIICTGHSRLIDEEKAAVLKIAAFVLKPVSIRKLAHTIREVLDR